MNRHSLETNFRLGLRSDEALASLMEATMGGVASIFTVAIPPASLAAAPIDAVYVLAGRAAGSVKRRLSIAFTWSHQGGFALPTMSGEIVVDDDAAARLFHEAIGARIGAKAFEALLTAIELLLTPRRRALREGSTAA